MSETVETPAPTETTQTPAPAEVQPPAAVAETEATLLRGGTRVVPEKYEFAPPEGVEVDPDALTNFEGAAREVGLTQEQFNKIAPLGAQLIAQKMAAAQAAAVPEFLRPDTQTKWQDTIKADPEIGGDKLGPALGLAARAIDRFGGPELRNALDLTRAGNNPAIVKAFVAIGKAMGEGEGLSTGRPAAGTAPQSGEQTARNLYNAGGGNYPPAAG